jgi:hypothetical protein
MSISAIPILPVSSNNNSFNATRLIEEASQTLYAGTPVSIASGDGGVQAWVANTQGPGQGGVIGISYEAGHNYASTGLGAPIPFQPLTGLGSSLTFGNVPNEPNASNIPMGAPFTDGRLGFILPGPDTVFSATFGNNGNTATPAATDVGKQYGLTLDSNSIYWYVDKNKTTGGTNTVLTVVGLDPRDVPAAGTRVLFVFLQNVINLVNVG